MKKIIVTVFASFMAFLAISQSSTITGNVLVIINGIENRADAGADVRLLDLSKTYATNAGYNNAENQISTSCDISGNFTFKNVHSGKYILYVSSKFSIANAHQIYTDLVTTMADPIMSITNFDITTHRPELQKSIDSLTDLIIKYGDEKKYNKMQKINKELDKKIDEFISSIPKEVQYFLKIYSGKTMSKDFKLIEIKPGIDENYAFKFEQTI